MTASTLAHEIGHNFGLYHNSFHQESLFDNLNFDFFNYSDYNITDYEDYNVTGNDDYDNTDYEESDDYCLCDADYCIMDAYAHLVVPVAFSTCQQNQIKQFLTTGKSEIFTPNYTQVWSYGQISTFVELATLKTI